jgi:hypothetical protein
MSAEQRLRMRRFEVAALRAIERLGGTPKPLPAKAAETKVLELPVPQPRSLFAESFAQFGRAVVRIFQFDRLLRVWWRRRVNKSAR